LQVQVDISSCNLECHYYAVRNKVRGPKHFKFNDILNYRKMWNIENEKLAMALGRQTNLEVFASSLTFAGFKDTMIFFKKYVT
jgi:hypothetical protein